MSIFSHFHIFTFLDYINQRTRPNRRPSFTPSVIKDIQIDEQLYDKDEIDRNILLYAGGLGNDGTNGQGPEERSGGGLVPTAQCQGLKDGTAADRE